MAHPFDRLTRWHLDYCRSSWQQPCEESRLNLHWAAKWGKELHLLDLQGDTLGHPNADGGPQDAVSTDLPLCAVLHHSPKETWSATWGRRHYLSTCIKGLVEFLMNVWMDRNVSPCRQATNLLRISDRDLKLLEDILYWALDLRLVVILELVLVAHHHKSLRNAKLRSPQQQRQQEK